MFPAFDRLLGLGKALLGKIRKARPQLFSLSLVLVLLPVQLFLFAGSSRSHYRLYALESRIATSLRQDHAGPPVYTFYLNGALETYEVRNPIISLWEEEIPTVEKGALILFNTSKFADQWAGKTLMSNWEYLNREYQLVELEDYGEGWELYEIQ